MFRASYTVLHFWQSGDIDRAVGAYMKISGQPTEAMVAGRLIHQQFEKEIKRTKALPGVFGGKKLVKPLTELKIEIELDDWLQLVGVIDCCDEDTIYDWKTGWTNSEVYANGMQPKVYQLLAPSAKRFEIHHINQYTGETDCALGYLTAKTKEDALNWVMENSIDMYSYLQKGGFA